MRKQPTYSSSDTSTDNAGPWLAYTPSAGISRRHWRRLISRDMTATFQGLTIRYSSFYRVCSPDIAIPNIRFIAFRRSSTSKLSMSSAIIEDLRRSYSNRLSRLIVCRNRAQRIKRRKYRLQLDDSWISIRPHESLSVWRRREPTEARFLRSRKSQDAAGSTTTAYSFTTSGGT